MLNGKYGRREGNGRPRVSEERIEGMGQIFSNNQCHLSVELPLL